MSEVKLVLMVKMCSGKIDSFSFFSPSTSTYKIEGKVIPLTYSMVCLPKYVLDKPSQVFNGDLLFHLLLNLLKTFLNLFSQSRFLTKNLFILIEMNR